MDIIEKYITYIRYEKRYSDHTVKAYLTDLKQYFSFITENYEIDLLITDFIHIRSWIVFLGNNNLSKRSINRKITTLKSFYKYCKVNKFIDVNPAIKIYLLKSSKQLPVYVDEESMDNLFCDDVFEDDYKGILSKTIIDLLYGTGMRVSELINLSEGDVDWHNNQLKVLGKRNKERIIPLNQNLQKSLHLYNKVRNEICIDSINDSYFFLRVNGKKIYHKFVYRIINNYLSIVTTIKKRSPHVIRHTFATHMLNNGADLNAIKDILGHASLSATQVYTHNSIDKLKNVYKQAHPKA